MNGIEKYSQFKQRNVHLENELDKENKNDNNESNYDSIYRNSESNIPSASTPGPSSSHNIQNFNRNNSQSSDIRIEQNMSQSSNTQSNTSSLTPNPLTTNNNFVKNKKISSGYAHNTSPKSGYTNKVRSVVENINSNPNISGTGVKSNTKHVFLEYQNKDNTNINQANTPAIMFNSSKNDYFNLNNKDEITNNYKNSHSRPTVNSTPTAEDNKLYSKYAGNQINTDSNFVNKKSNGFTNEYSEGGSSSNRLPTGSNYEYSSTLLNDMKYNAPLKDEFNHKVSKNRERSKEPNNRSDVHFNFNVNNLNNYIVKNEDNNIGTNTNTVSGSGSGVGVGSGNIQKTSDFNLKIKLDKLYPKLVIAGNGSPKNGNNNTHYMGGVDVQNTHGTNNTNTNTNNVNMNMNMNMNKFKDGNTYTLNYKEKIMKSFDPNNNSNANHSKSAKLNYQNFNVSNAFQKKTK